MTGLIKRETMGAQLASLLRGAILSGEFEPGEPVTETALALRFGVSRGPMREAMRHLVDEGLLVTVPYTGTRVLQLTSTDIEDIYSMRICLEVFAFEQIWERRDEAFRQSLMERHAALLKAIDARIDDRVYAVLTVDASVASRRSHGGTAPDQVRARIAQAKEELG